MKHETSSRPSILSAVAAAALILASASPGLAQGKSKGNSAAHMSAQGIANGNGRNSADRDFGRDRAAERMNDRDLAYRTANTAETRATDRLNREATRTARLTAAERANLAIDRDDRVNNHGANKAGFCPPGQAKKAGNGSRFNC